MDNHLFILDQCLDCLRVNGEYASAAINDNCRWFKSGNNEFDSNFDAVLCWYI